MGAKAQLPLTQSVELLKSLIQPKWGVSLCLLCDSVHFSH